MKSDSGRCEIEQRVLGTPSLWLYITYSMTIDKSTIQRLCDAADGNSCCLGTTHPCGHVMFTGLSSIARVNDSNSGQLKYMSLPCRLLGALYPIVKLGAIGDGYQIESLTINCVYKISSCLHSFTSVASPRTMYDLAKKKEKITAAQNASTRFPI
ncbi:hypothetical protein K504DRAFT_42016 [Pleomassaria siparia CBS 279.74]|uniref:Uncharacterized protein n=1 Tax=Pleomassaria siparia CBS 279.74 TaxID=1314801 RepID=A0A6G1K4A8_9PLEO|nr:hypothetical protein K504DRAFT_42016 [Pleomassaria siparia CBS 279.74]